MEGMHEALAKLDDIELLIIKAGEIVSVLLICLLAIWDRIKPLFRGKRKKSESNRKEKRSSERK